MKKLKNIVMIGPVYPYKGGISHYTCLMYRALREKFNIRMISYSMQYPKFLFKKEQKDYGNKSFKIDEAKYFINTANPLSCISSALTIRSMTPDLVIFQWWHPYFAPCYWIMEKVLGRKIKKMFVCHNVFPHERFPMDKFLTRMALRGGDYFITHSEQDSEDLSSIKRNAVYAHTVLPTFNVFKLKGMTESEARKILNIRSEEKMLLFFGFVREYKGLRYIIEALPEIISSIGNVKLYIVGDFGDDKEKYLNQISKLKVESYIEIVDGYTPDDEVEKFFMASDLVILPYESATQSAIVQTAYGFEIPVVVTNVGGLPEVVEDGKTGYVVETKNAHALAEAVETYFKGDKKKEFQDNIRKKAYQYSWDKMVNVINELYTKR